MKNLTPSTIMMLLVSALIFFFIGRITAPVNNIGSAESMIDKEIFNEKSPPTDEDGNIISNEDIVKENESEDSAAVEVMVIEEIEPSPSIPSLNSLVTSTSLRRPNFGISDNKIGEVLTKIAESLESKNLAYVSSLMQDCSGIFHQMKDSLQTRLPALSHGSEYQ